MSVGHILFALPVDFRLFSRYGHEHVQVLLEVSLLRDGGFIYYRLG